MSDSDVSAWFDSTGADPKIIEPEAIAHLLATVPGQFRVEERLRAGMPLSLKQAKQIAYKLRNPNSRGQGRPRPERTTWKDCETCGDPFQAFRKTGRFCSRQCYPSENAAFRRLAIRENRCERCGESTDSSEDLKVRRTDPTKARTLENVTVVCGPCSSALSHAKFWERWPKGKRGYVPKFRLENPDRPYAHPDPPEEVSLDRSPVGRLV